MISRIIKILVIKAVGIATGIDQWNRIGIQGEIYIWGKFISFRESLNIDKEIDWAIKNNVIVT